MSFLYPDTVINIEKIVINIREEEPNKVRLILKQNINNSIYQLMALSIASNQKSLGTLGLVDQVTGLPVTGTFTGAVANSDTTAAFTASVDASGNIVVTGVAPGSGNLTASATAAFTDSTGASQSQPLSVTVPVTITAVVTADAVNLVINFGPATAQ